eukprot:7091595-Prymnesium_polylepis.1
MCFEPRARPMRSHLRDRWTQTRHPAPIPSRSRRHPVTAAVTSQIYSTFWTALAEASCSTGSTGFSGAAAAS